MRLIKTLHSLPVLPVAVFFFFALWLSCGDAKLSEKDIVQDLGSVMELDVASDTSGPFPSPCAESDRFVAVDKGPIITSDLLNMPADVTIADNTSYLRVEGDVRLYFWAGKMGLESTGAYSVRMADESDLVLEEGIRVPSPYGHPKSFRHPSGQVRMFHLIPDGLGSHISEDGVNFTLEEGVRISSVDAGLERIGGMSVVALPEGGYRGYFSNLGIPGVAPQDTVDQLKSATSTDQLNWSMDDGVRIGEEAPILTAKVRQPFALDRGDGCITLFYQGIESIPTKLYYATSLDGLSFSTEFELGIEGWDGSEAGANIQQLGDGSFRLFYDAQSTELGNHIRAAAFQRVP